MQRLFQIIFLTFISLSMLCSAALAQATDTKQPSNKPKATAAEADKEDKQPSEKEEAASEKADDSNDEKPAQSDEADDDTEKQETKEADSKEKSTEKTDKAKKPEKKKPKPHKVEAEKLTIEVELDGIFVASDTEEIALRPEVWSRFKVLEAVEHGTKVKKGDVLVRFDDEDLEEDLAEEALDQSIGQLSLLQEEEELPRVKRLLELSFENAERRFQQTKEDYEYYHSTDRPITVQITNFRYESAKQQLEAAQEELKQLQQMYDADELTEETEEIVLRRQKFAVETAELVLSLNKESRDYTLNVSLPRSDKYYETSLEEAELAYKQAKTAVEMGATRKSYEMEKKREARAKSVERHGKLLSDKGLMELRAPCDGVVYYGKCTNGKWSQINTMKAKLKPFGSVTANSVLMTIVKPGALHIESSIGEKDLAEISESQTATVIPTADKDLEWSGKITSVQAVPGASNKFQVLLDFEAEDTPDWLAAGLTCDANVITYEKEDAVVIPQSMVQTDEGNDKIKYVMLVDPEEDEPIRRKVKLGRKKDKIVEVLKGLEPGDEIVKEDKKKDED